MPFFMRWRIQIVKMKDFGNCMNSVGLKSALAQRCSWIAEIYHFFNNHQLMCYFFGKRPFESIIQFAATKSI
jgi:hypothetical protein